MTTTNRTVLSVMLIDDDREDAFLVRRALMKLDAEIEFEHNLDSVLFIKSLDTITDAQTIPDIVLIDINMPRVNGFEILEAVRGHKAFDHSKIIMLTTSETEEDEAEALRLGAQRFVTKPSTGASLAAFAESLLGIAGCN